MGQRRIAEDEGLRRAHRLAADLRELRRRAALRPIVQPTLTIIWSRRRSAGARETNRGKR